MHDPLLVFTQLSQTPPEAIRWACILEATAPKPGNVFPGRSFSNLGYVDFVIAAEIAAECLGREGRISQRMLETVIETGQRCPSNVNLGIVLLLGPLVAADQQLTRAQPIARAQPSSVDSLAERTSVIWKGAIAQQLAQFDGVDGRNVFRAIAISSAGGLGASEAMDVHQSHDSVDLIAAMKLAADRDRIARQYATGFADLVDNVVPLIRESILQSGDLLHGICHAHVRLLAQAPDSLIARKNGLDTAITVQNWARSIQPGDPQGLHRLDASLRDPENKRNPGTTADLMAAGLYLLLRSHVVNLNSPPNPAQD